MMQHNVALKTMAILAGHHGAVKMPGVPKYSQRPKAVDRSSNRFPVGGGPNSGGVRKWQVSMDSTNSGHMVQAISPMKTHDAISIHR